MILADRTGITRSLQTLSAEDTSTDFCLLPFCHHIYFRKMQGDFGLKSLKSKDAYEGLHFKFFVTFIICQEPCFTLFQVLVFLNDKPNPPFSLSRSPASAESLNATTSAKPSQPPAVSAKHHPCLAGQAYFYSS